MVVLAHRYGFHIPPYKQKVVGLIIGDETKTYSFSWFQIFVHKPFRQNASSGVEIEILLPRKASPLFQSGCANLE